MYSIGIVYFYARLLTGWMQDFVSKNGDLDMVFDRRVSCLPNEMFYRTMENYGEYQLNKVIIVEFIDQLLFIAFETGNHYNNYFRKNIF